MKKKRLLSLLLALVMMVSLLPLNVFAAEVESDLAEDMTAPVEETIPVDETEPAEEPAEQPAEQPAEEPAPVEEPLAAAMPAALSDNVAVAAASTKQGGTNAEQPFPAASKTHYRIPAFVTTGSGTLVAAADVRWKEWKTPDDAGDIDTILSRSTDNGKNWTYTYPNYIDNGETGNYNYPAATFIDPALAVKGETIYMIVDLFPGRASNSKDNNSVAAKTGTGYDSQGRLLLSTNASATASSAFTYYLDGGKIYDSKGTDQGYTVDAYFNVTKDGTDCGNLFNYDNTCGFHPLMTSYLYLTTSPDGGATWSEPKMLNPQVKNSNERIFLNSPGRGLVTSDGIIVFGAYTWNNLCLIYSKDGVNWKRVTSNIAYSDASENEIVELADGTLRMFVRHSGNQLKYVDITKSGDTYAFGTTKTVANTTVQGSCNVSAISYSQTYNGQQVLLVSCPGSTGGRFNGKIFTFTVGSDNKMTLRHTHEVNGANDGYSYSCLTEQGDGSIGLLYEKGDSGNITYVNYPAATVTGLTFASESTVTDAATGITAKAVGLTSITVETKDAVKGETEVSKTYSITLNGGSYTGAAALTIPVDAAFEGCTEFYGKVGSDTFDVAKDTDGNNFVCKVVPHFSDVTIYGTLAETGSEDEAANTENIELAIGETSEKFTVDGKYTAEADFTALDKTIATVNTVDASETGTPAGSTVVSMDNDGTYTGKIGNGTQWLILDDSGISSTNNPAEATEFTVTRSTSYYVSTTYTIQASNGKYLGYTSSGTTYAPSVATEPVDWSYYSGRGFYTSNRYLTNSNGSWTMARNNSASPYAQLRTPYDAVPGASKTTITFTGVAPGTTSVTVGGTRYNITVNPVKKESAVNLTTGSSTTLNALNVLGWTHDDYTVNYALTAGNCVTLSGVAVIAGNTEGKATVTATVSKGEKTYATVTYNITVASYIVPTAANTPIIGGDTMYDTYGSAAASSSNTYTPNYLGQDKEITALVITSGSTYDLDIASNYSGTVTWGSTDESVITVDQNGVVTAVATPTGDDVAEAYVTATINGLTYAIPVTVVASSVTSSTSYTRTLDMYNNLEYNCTAYYSYRLGALRELPQGAQVFVQQDADKDQDLITFFATPDDGYALTYVNGTNGTYFHAIRDDRTEEGYGYTANSDGSCDDSLGRTDGGYAWLHDQLIGYTYNNSIDLDLTPDEYLQKMHAMLKDAADKGCDGGFFWSRYKRTSSYAYSMQSTLTFIAEKLPEMHKELTGVTTNGVYQPYTEGMTVDVGDTLHYTIYAYVPTMAKKTESQSIAYTDFTVEDELTGAKWIASELNSETAATSFTYSKNGASRNVNVTTGTGTNPGGDGSVYRSTMESFQYDKNGEEITYSESSSNAYAFHTDLTLTQENFATVVTNGTITNQATLDYTYKAKYSKGARAAKSFTVIVNIMVKAPSYVIDFGLPVSIDLDDIVSGVSFEIAEVPKYGTASIENGKLTYTPNTILPESDFITLSYTSGNKTLGTGVRIYPATSVFYEESFLTYTGSWADDGTKVTSNQNLAVLGADTNNYGYDPAYNSVNSGSYKVSNTVDDTATFTFAGTGFQLYANSNENSGIVTVYRDGQVKKVYMIDTELSAGDTAATNQQTGGTYYSLPIISETALPYDTYKVTITHTHNTDPLYIDGVRVLGTMSDSTIYKDDLEDNPNFYELRDYVLKAIGVENGASDYGTVADMAGQVYNAAGVNNSAIVIDASASYADENTAQDLLDNGPKNELYLYGGQTLVFKVTTNRVMQLGLKAPTGTATYSIAVNEGAAETKTLNTCVDMFYEIAGKATAAQEYTVTISNTGNKVLSVTLLKICDDPNAAFVPLTQDDIEGALLGIYGISREETSEPTDPVKPTDPVEPTDPDMPDVPDEPDDEPDTQTTTLTVNYVNLFGRKVGTATLTKEMTDGSWRISAREINANAPAGRRALCLFPVTVEAGQQKTIVIPVL